jgi:Uma2 family endonuclease
VSSQVGFLDRLAGVAAPKITLATSADLATLDAGVRAEVIHGVVVRRASPTGEHGVAQGSFLGILNRRFQRKPGGRWPGGWWFGSEIEVEYESHEVYVHDVVGWRRDRMPEMPSGRPVRVRPDWVCEILSPTNAKHDTVDKLQVLHANQVPHYWIANPLERTLTVHRWDPNGFLVVLTAAAGDTVRAEPFESVDLSLAKLFALEEDDE